MNAKTLQALGFVVAAAVMNAIYTLPMKVNRKWQWEHSWFAFTTLGVVGVPTVLAMLTVPDLWSIYETVPRRTLLAMALFGAGWGVSLVLFGLALPLVGIAITFAVCLGTSAASGALIPLLVQHSEKVFTRQGALIIAGVVLIFVGVGLCGLAGQQRDRSGLKAPSLRGICFAFLSGVLGSLFNLGLAYGGPIQQAARARGAAAAMMSNAVWLPCLYAGFVPGVLYCVYLMKKNRNLCAIAASGTWHYWFMGMCMGVLWYGSIMLYSVSALRLGELGPAIGWPLFLSTIVIASTITGLLAGEWSHATTGPFRTMVSGVLCLVIAIAVLSFAST